MNASRRPGSGSRRHEGTRSTTSPSWKSWLLGFAAPSTSRLAIGSKRSWTTYAPLLTWSLSSASSDDQGDVRIGFRLCQEMSWFWYACGYPEEGRRWLEQATQRVKGDEPEEIAVLHGLAVILLQQGEATPAQQLLTRCLDYWRSQGNDQETAKELNSLGVSYRDTGDWEKARELLEEAIVAGRAQQ